MRRPVVRLPRSALCRSGEILSPVPLCLLIARVPLSRIARPRIPRPRWLGGPAGARARTRTRRIRPRPLRLVEPRGPGTTRGRRALTWPGSRAARPWAGARRAWPGTTNAGHRVLGTLPGPVGGSGVVHRLPGRAWRVSGPWRHAALRPGPRRSWRHVRGAGAVALPAARVALVIGVDGVGVCFQVGVPLVSVAVRVGGVAGPAVRASVRPAALTIHPAPPDPACGARHPSRV
jgi:hypothetical protein